MVGRCRRSKLINYVTLSCLSVSTVLLGQALPDGKGRAEFERTCTACHAATMATRLSKTQAEWRGVVDDMVSRGAQGTETDLDNIVLYLSANFGPGKGAGAAVPQPAPAATAAATTVAVALNPGEIERAKRVVAANGCIACHRIGEEGAYIAPPLDGIGTRRKADEIRAAIINPHPIVAPENRQVRLLTADDKTITGKILNQDGYSVQLVDASGRLVTYSKSGLREFTIIDTNPMPSFGSKITGQDLDDLVRYLSSLTEPGK